MLRSIRLITIVLLMVILSSVAPLAVASPSQSYGLDLDVSSNIEAVLATLERALFGWAENPYLSSKSGTESQPEADFGAYDPNGIASEAPDGAGDDGGSNFGAYDPNGIASAASDGISNDNGNNFGAYDPNG